MTELVFVLIFTAAGAGAALLALRLAGGSHLVRWLAFGFCLLALGNLALHAWHIVARDPAGAMQAAAIAILLLPAVWGYRRLLRALRRAAERRGP